MQSNRLSQGQYSEKTWLIAAVFSLFLLAFPFSPCLAQPTDTPKRILFVPSYNYNYLGIQWFNRGVMAGLAEQENIKATYSLENLQLAAHPGDEPYFETMAAALRIKYAQEKPDLIIAQYKQATQFMLRYGHEIFGDVPVVFAGLEIENYTGLKFPANYTGITTSFNAKRNIELILQLHPSTKKIYIIAGVGSAEIDMVAEVMKTGELYAGRVQMVALNQLPIDQLLAQIGNIKENAALIYLSMQIDVNGKILVPAEVAKSIGRAAQVPAYGMLDTHEGSGITGGYFISHENLGKRAAKIGGDILRGMPPAAIAIVNEPIGSYTFDWRQLARWNVSEDKLPPDSKVDFKQFSLWDEYKWEIIAALCLIFLQSCLVIALIINRFRLKQAELVLQESEERYRAALEQSSDAIAIVDIQTLKLLQVNRRWSNIMGYSAVEAETLLAYDVIDDKKENLDANYNCLLKKGYLPQQLARFRRKDGSIVEMERSAAVIKYSGKQVMMFTSRDVSKERKLQELLRKEVSLAADVQRSFVADGFVDTLVTVKTIYAPYQLVSGDFFDFGWNPEHNRFSGFLLDISGHGVASSLRGIAVSTYFRSVMESQMNLPAKLQWINQQVMRYFTDETYAAAICFEFDFTRQTLNFSTAGVYGFLAHSGALPAVVKKAGSLIGVSASPEYTEWSVPICAGDTFYFMSDGIFEPLEMEPGILVDDFENTVELLRKMANRQGRRDDCSAVCIRVNGSPTFPLQFDFYRPGEYSRIRSRVRDLLLCVAGGAAGKLDVAVGEALNNAARVSMDVKVKFNFFGSRIVIRVKDGGKGFDGNARVAKYKNAEKANAFEERLYAEGGRGILIMVAWMDKVVYNRQGNEVMLVKRLTK